MFGRWAVHPTAAASRWTHVAAAAGDGGEDMSWSAARILRPTQRHVARRGRPRGLSPPTRLTAAEAPLQLDAVAAAAAVAAAGLLPAPYGGQCEWHVAGHAGTIGEARELWRTMSQLPSLRPPNEIPHGVANLHETLNCITVRCTCVPVRIGVNRGSCVKSPIMHNRVAIHL